MSTNTSQIRVQRSACQPWCNRHTGDSAGSYCTRQIFAEGVLAQATFSHSEPQKGVYYFVEGLDEATLVGEGPDLSREQVQWLSKMTQTEEGMAALKQLADLTEATHE